MTADRHDWAGIRRLGLFAAGVEGRLLAVEVAAALGLSEARCSAPGEPLPPNIDALFAAPADHDELATLMFRIGSTGLPTVVCVPDALLDPAFAALDGAHQTLLCRASLPETVAAVALALAAPATGGVAEQEDREALHRLSQEAARIARALAAIASGTRLQTPRLPDEVAVPPADAANRFRRMLRERRLRDSFFAAELFADPAWDMLLDLAAAREEGRAVSVSSLCIAAAVPPTTALRWIRALTDAGLFERVPDPADRRRTFIAATDHAVAAMAGYLGALDRLR